MDNVQESEYQELAGDPDHLQTMAHHYLSIADKIRASVPVLHTLSEGDEQKSKATDALKHSAKKVADDIDKAESRYRVTAEALLEYVPYLRTAQSDAHTAVVNIQSAQGDVETTGKALTKANTAVTDAATNTSTTADAAKTAKSDQTTAQTNATNAQQDLDHWKSKWRDARDYRDTHAHAARNKIYDLIEHHNNGLKNPETHWWDSVGHFFSSAWHDIKAVAEGALKILQVICKIASFLSIFLAWVPILGDVLLVLAVIVAAITLIQDLAAGKGWRTILGDSIGLVLTAFGGPVGKYFGKLAKFDRLMTADGAVSKFVNGAKNEDFLASKAFTKTFGFTKNRLRSALESGDVKGILKVDLSVKDVKDLQVGGLEGFLRNVRNPLKYDFSLGLKGNLDKLPGEFAKFKSNPLGLVSKDLGFTNFKLLSTGQKLPILIADGRKILGTTQTLTNDINDWAHGDGTLSGKHSPQVYLTPDKLIAHAG